jgi:bifunctional DNase/RNase
VIYSTHEYIRKIIELMNKKILRLLFVSVCLSVYISALSQERSDSIASSAAIIDSLKKSGVIFNDNRKKPEINLTTSQAVDFLQQRFQPQYWNNTNDPLRIALGQLIFEASHPPVDSSEYYLKRYPFDSLNIPWDKFYIWEPLRLKIPVTTMLNVVNQQDSTIKADSNLVVISTDSLNNKSDTIPKQVAHLLPVHGVKDTTIMVIIDTLKEVTSARAGFPFRYLTFPYQADSIQVAVKSLLNYLETRDSSVINFTGIHNQITPLWMNSKSAKMIRYWLKNEFADSVTIWIGNTSKNTIGLYLEQGVNFRRPVKQGNISEARIDVKTLDNTKLLDVQRIILKQIYWKYRTEASFVLSQSSMSNWVRGGESSISTALDITGYADYKNSTLKLSSNNFARLKFGYIASGENGIRKNLDLLETNSKLNHKAFGKFDFSGIMLFKTQIAPGYNYPNDSVPVSKFMNPAIVTIGFGLDYKPNKNTSINFSPLSYKGTFVPDTAHIDQTKYGIAHNRKSLNEPGVSFMITNEYKPIDKVTVTNRLQLFTNYIHNPQNIDVDWEMIVVASLNWFTDVRFNTHLIFDDDTKTVELDENKQPVKRADGSIKKTARIQFKEMLGFSLAFRF